jgi:hypothetical protein
VVNWRNCENISFRKRFSLIKNKNYESLNCVKSM